ncbi:sperm receptor for egg jelly-like [Saccostrea echinata]|uniref:sperm receptor for egg jelly-like n=1 Tax=Saccostrea echinata TaxID=191078 RepID=UPI002A80CC9A|nr:sperm receptor for egg jelly-like [Saccostrea echinata]
MVEAVYRVNGVNVTTSTTAIGTNENVNFTITATSAANFPQGQIKVNISFGDDSTDQTVDLSDVTTLQGTGYQVQRPYTSQGNYTAILTFYNELGSYVISKEIYIWDQLSVTLSSAFASIAGQPLSFDFISPPNSNFHFSISYGDGNLYEVTDANLTQSYSHMPWNHTYTNSGTFNVTMTAWNPFYVSVCSYQVTSQAPLLPDNTTLSPTSDEIPYPDGIVNFTLVMTADVPSPDAVLCTFDYGDSTVDTNESTVFDYNVAVTKSHTYTSAGTFTFTANCSNLISTMQKMATIVVHTFTMQDFGLHVQNPVPMNMSTEAFTPTIDYRHPVKPKPIPREVAFALTLFNCSRMPPNITATWNFGDGTISSPALQSTFDKQHTYNVRETLTVNVVLKNNNGDQKTITTNLVLGFTTLNSDKQAAPIGTGVFTLTATGTPGTPSFVFDSDSDDTASCTSGVCTVSYAKYGTYLPSVTATYESLTEIVYLSEPLAADYDMTGNLAIEFSNTTVHLPPGTVTITITTSTMSFPFVRCSLLSGDLIDNSLHEKVQNITPTEPMVFPYTYQTLGNHSLTANCSNHLTTIPISNSVYARNPCFTKNGIFDRQYSVISNPMKVFTSQDVYISSRMGVICVEKTADFGWEIFSNYSSEEDKIKFPYTNPISPSKGKMLFPRGKIAEGKYLVTLNVSLDGTWIKEPIVVQFIKPAPYAYIVGGSKKMARKMDTIIDINALDESYDAEGGFGKNENLSFSWGCKTVNTSVLDEIEIIVNNNFTSSTFAIEGCTLDAGPVPGKKKLNITTSPGYIVTVSVSDGKKSSEFSQMLSILEGDPPDVKLECIINCKEKLAVTSRMNVLAKCLDCTETELPSYEWSLMEFVGSEWTTIDLVSKTANGINNQALVLKENTLDPGKKYMVTLETTVASRSGPSTAIMDLATNYPPYDGECSVTPTTGLALKDKFSIECSGWVDEGTNMERNLTRDKKNGEPLTYLYETITKRNLSTGIQDVKTEVFRGGESTVTDVPLQLGDPAFDYNVTVRVHIYDRIGDKAIFERNIKVKPMENVTPNSSSDTTAINSLFESFEEAFNITNAGGNDMGVVRLVSSVSSYIVDFSEGDSQGTTEEDILSGSASSLTTSTTSEVTLLYQKKTAEMTNILLKTVDADSDTPKQFSATDVQQISSALESITRSPAYITAESAAGY